MSIVLLVYLASIVGSLKVVTGIAAGLLTTILIIYNIAVAIYNLDCNYYKRDKTSVKHVKKILSVIALSLLVNVLTPSEKAVYIIAGASIAQDIANSPKTAATLDKVYKIVDKKLEEQLSEGIDKATKKIENKVEETVK